MFRISTVLFFLLLQNLSAEQLKVGVIAGFSGHYASYGESYRQGLELGDPEKEINFIYEDDQFLAAKTISAFHKLVQKDQVQAIVVGDNVTASAIAPLAIKYQIPTIVWANQGEIFLNNPYIFRLGTTNEEEFSETIKILNQLTSGSLQIFVHPHSYSIVWGREIFARYSTTDKFLTELPDTHQDFRALLLKAKSKQIKNLAICLNPGDNGRFIKQLQQLDYQAEVFACNFIESTPDRQAMKDYSRRVLFFAPDLHPDFINRYQLINPNLDHIVSVAIMYDTSKILKLAINNKSSETLNSKIQQIQAYHGAHTKSELVRTSGDQYLRIPFNIFQIQNGIIECYIDRAKKGFY